MRQMKRILAGVVLWILLLSGCTSSPVDSYKLLREAGQAVEEGDLQRALQDYDRLTELMPQNGAVYNGRGAVLLELGKYEPALSDLEKAVELDDGNTVYWYNLGLARYCLQDYEESVEDFSRALSLNAKYADAYGRRAAAYACLGRYEEAETDLERAEDLAPGQNATYLALLGSAYLTAGEAERAKALLDQAIEIDSDHPEYYLQRAQAQILAGQYEQAQEDCVQAISMREGFLAGYAVLGDLYYAQQQYEQAIANYTVALLEQPDAEGYLIRGKCYAALGKYEEAETDFTQAILLEPDMASAYVERGDVREQMGDPDEALKDYKKARDLLREGEE